MSISGLIFKSLLLTKHNDEEDDSNWSTNFQYPNPSTQPRISERTSFSRSSIIQAVQIFAGLILATGWTFVWVKFPVTVTIITASLLVATMLAFISKKREIIARTRMRRSTKPGAEGTKFDFPQNSVEIKSSFSPDSVDRQLMAKTILKEIQARYVDTEGYQ